ncbi:MAG: dethiobiotin synthase [Porticoccaceae bacterium]
MAVKTYFVTGTDTDVGKTLAATGLIEVANRQGRRTAAIKPVAAGCEDRGDGLQNSDALQLQAAASHPLSYQQVNPIALQAAIAPHIAAEQEGRSLSAQRLSGFCRGLTLLPVDILVIEGAGGWYVPLNHRETLADVAKQLNPEIILVVGLRLGCINHALLSIKAIRADGLKIAGWIGSTIDPDMPQLDKNIATLERLIAEPCLGVIPRLTDLSPQRVAEFIKLPS